MPTGYTKVIGDKKGLTFNEFAMRCARAFGACVEMRDDSLDVQIPDKFEPSDYHRKEIERSQAELKRLSGFSLRQKIEFGLKQLSQSYSYNKKQVGEIYNLKQRYEDMLSQVNNWVPPTSEHEGLKKFMAEQITESIDFDCNTKYYEEDLETMARNNPLALFQARLKQLRRDIIYHRKEHRKEVERAKGRTNWVKALRRSLRSA